MNIENDLPTVISLHKKFKRLQKNQKMRGLNDFNLFTTLLDKSDEVRLHSRFLHFLLDPTAEHSQGALFQEKLSVID